MRQVSGIQVSGARPHLETRLDGADARDLRVGHVAAGHRQLQVLGQWCGGGEVGRCRGAEI